MTDEKIIVQIKRTDNAKDLPLPKYMSSQAAGMDLYANIEDSIIIPPGKFKTISTGIMIALPKGYEAQVRPRSGLAFKHGITVLNSPGTVDADYRGEINIVLINLSEKDFTVNRGDRVAQMVINKIEYVSFEETDALPESERGSGGFGSTGI
ncbi:deoxyuridine 5'-triphosphate nucleotidohydrolase [Oxobacter pfennigii]|uniref:Deoxyuridine 5'-triphosphate nucleotidohydrolase n=1 Tax=Oxobacter pfennigii TaxID=36849 RepID=A0A0P8W815_9CLOT|nr:dUTP diphosphatase [Oxobacter pfennigii]KPU43894.1 deoxyuridine 5'-triphosphate nucleotidohydrolase [Oxobacter pfennigii]